MPYGDRRYMVEDRWGNTWQICLLRETRAVKLDTALDDESALKFAERWLPAWTGNQPERLAAFYSDDVFSDPSVQQGLRGRDALLAYFRKLLARNPQWVWSARGSLPLADGFLNEWHASMLGAERVEVDGVCTVQLRDGL